MKNQGNRNREGDSGQAGRDSLKSTGTAGRQGSQPPDNAIEQPVPGRRHNRDDDEDSGLGNRTTNR